MTEHDQYPNSLFLTVLECRALCNLLSGAQAPLSNQTQLVASAQRKLASAALVPLLGDGNLPSKSADGATNNALEGDPAIAHGSIEIPAGENLTFEFDQA